MSYSKEEMQIMFDDMTMLMSEIIPSFKADALSKTIEEIEASYGVKARVFLEEVSVKLEKEKEINVNVDNETFLAQALGGFSADDILPILEFWIKKCPEKFKTLLERYPGVLSFLSNAEASDQLLDGIEGYVPSDAVSAEYVGAKGNSIEKEQYVDFVQSANWSLTALFGMGDNVKRGWLKGGHQDIYVGENAIALDPKLVNENKGERKKNQEKGAEKMLGFLLQEEGRKDDAEKAFQLFLQLKKQNLKAMSVTGQSEIEDIKQYNAAVLKLAILEGKTHCKVVVKDSRFKQKLKVADRIGFNTVGKTAFERLELASHVESAEAFCAAQKIAHTIESMETRKKALGDNVINDGSRTAKEYIALSKGIAILNEASTYLVPPFAVNGSPESRDTFTEDVPEEMPVTERLALFDKHYKENENVMSDKPIKKLLKFIDTMKHFFNGFGKKLDKPKQALSYQTVEVKVEPDLKYRKLDANDVRLSDSAQGMFKHDNNDKGATDPEALKAGMLDTQKAAPAA